MAGTESMPNLVVDALKRGEDAALDAVRKCTDTIEEALGATADDSAVRTVTSSVFEMVDRLLTVQYEFMRNMIGIGTETVKEVTQVPSKVSASCGRTRP